MPVTAGIVRNPNRGAVVTLIQMTPQFCGTANLDGPHDPMMSNGNLMSFSISRPKSPEDIGNF
jgi:hypothetical protein